MCFIFFELRCSIQDLISWNIVTLNPWVAILPMGHFGSKSGGLNIQKPASVEVGLVPWCLMDGNKKSLQKHHHGCKRLLITNKPTQKLHLYAALTTILTAFLMSMVLCFSCLCVREKELYTQTLSHFVKPVCVWGRNKFILWRPYYAAFKFSLHVLFYVVEWIFWLSPLGQ